MGARRATAGGRVLTPDPLASRSLPTPTPLAPSCRRHRSKSPGHKAKKEAKAAARREREAADARTVAELSMYTATDNPFNDANLGSQFKWVKKAEKEKKAGMSAEEAARRDVIRRQEAKVRPLELAVAGPCLAAPSVGWSARR